MIIHEYFVRMKMRDLIMIINRSLWRILTGGYTVITKVTRILIEQDLHFIPVRRNNRTQKIDKAKFN